MRNTLWIFALSFLVAGAACNRVVLEADRGKLERGAMKSDGSNSCKDQCGGQAPAGCWCDAACAQHGDCCQDKGAQCDAQPGSCKGHCGGMSPGGCFCDDQCAQLGDCCGDKAQECDATNPPPACATAKDCGACLGIAGCNWTGGTCAETCLQDTDCYGPGNPAANACPAGPPACNILDEPACLARSDCEPMWGVCLMYCQPSDPGCCAFEGCKPKGCPPVVCTLACQYGFKKGADGCELCECADPPACAAMAAGGDGLCDAILGYAWGGQSCLTLTGCSCVGADCGKLFKSMEACEAAYAACIDCTGSWIDVANGNCYGPNDGALPDACCDTSRKALCEQANTSYKAALAAARSCSPFVTAPQCTQYVDEDLMCPICGTFVNDRSQLKQHEDRWSTLRCAATGGTKGWWGCPPVVCDPPLSGVCDVNTRSCQDVFTP